MLMYNHLTISDKARKGKYKLPAYAHTQPFTSSHHLAECITSYNTFFCTDTITHPTFNAHTPTPLTPLHKLLLTTGSTILPYDNTAVAQSTELPQLKNYLLQKNYASPTTYTMIIDWDRKPITTNTATQHKEVLAYLSTIFPVIFWHPSASHTPEMFKGRLYIPSLSRIDKKEFTEYLALMMYDRFSTPMIVAPTYLANACYFEDKLKDPNTSTKPPSVMHEFIDRASANDTHKMNKYSTDNGRVEQWVEGTQRPLFEDNLIPDIRVGSRLSKHKLTREDIPLMDLTSTATMEDTVRRAYISAEKRGYKTLIDFVEAIDGGELRYDAQLKHAQSGEVNTAEYFLEKCQGQSANFAYEPNHKAAHKNGYIYLSAGGVYSDRGEGQKSILTYIHRALEHTNTIEVELTGRLSEQLVTTEADVVFVEAATGVGKTYAFVLGLPGHIVVVPTNALGEDLSSKEGVTWCPALKEGEEGTHYTTAMMLDILKTGTAAMTYSKLMGHIIGGMSLLDITLTVDEFPRVLDYWVDSIISTVLRGDSTKQTILLSADYKFYDMFEPFLPEEYEIQRYLSPKRDIHIMDGMPDFSLSNKALIYVQSAKVIRQLIGYLGVDICMEVTRNTTHTQVDVDAFLDSGGRYVLFTSKMREGVSILSEVDATYVLLTPSSGTRNVETGVNHAIQALSRARNCKRFIVSHTAHTPHSYVGYKAYMDALTPLLGMSEDEQLNYAEDVGKVAINMPKISELRQFIIADEAQNKGWAIRKGAIIAEVEKNKALGEMWSMPKFIKELKRQGHKVTIFTMKDNKNEFGDFKYTREKKPKTSTYEEYKKQVIEANDVHALAKIERAESGLEFEDLTDKAKLEVVQGKKDKIFYHPEFYASKIVKTLYGVKTFRELSDSFKKFIKEDTLKTLKKSKFTSYDTIDTLHKWQLDFIWCDKDGMPLTVLKGKKNKILGYESTDGTKYKLKRILKTPTKPKSHSYDYPVGGSIDVESAQLWTDNSKDCIERESIDL